MKILVRALDEGHQQAVVTDAHSRSEDLVGQIVEGRYKIERVIGKGGRGTVYACRHAVVGKVFEGTGLEYGDVLGAASVTVGYECDGCDMQFADGLGMPRPNGFASHEETVDRYRELTGRPVRWPAARTRSARGPDPPHRCAAARSGRDHR